MSVLAVFQGLCRWVFGRIGAGMLGFWDTFTRGFCYEPALGPAMSTLGRWDAGTLGRWEN